MNDNIKNMTAVQRHYFAAFFVSLAVAFGLLISSFCLPPTGQIDPSVLQGTSIIFLWPVLGFGAKVLEEGHRAKIQKGDTTITIDGEKEE